MDQRAPVRDLYPSAFSNPITPPPPVIPKMVLAALTHTHMQTHARTHTHMFTHPEWPEQQEECGELRHIPAGLTVSARGVLLSARRMKGHQAARDTGGTPGIEGRGSSPTGGLPGRRPRFTAKAKKKKKEKKRNKRGRGEERGRAEDFKNTSSLHTCHQLWSAKLERESR